MSTIGARRLTILDFTLPPSGAWIGEGVLDSGDMPTPGKATLTVGDLVLACRVLPQRGGLDAPARPHVVLAGGYGWRTPLPMGAYTSATGVRLSTVLADLSRLADEPVGPAVEVSLGKSYGWPAGTRGLTVLADLVARGAIPSWRVRPDGRTVFTPWPSSGAADASGVIEDRDLARGVRFVALDQSIAAWLPGATVQSTMVARAIFHEAEGETKVTTWQT